MPIDLSTSTGTPPYSGHLWGWLVTIGNTSLFRPLVGVAGDYWENLPIQATCGVAGD
jgi:hypothetical protein